MKLAQINALIAIVDAESFTAAAEALSISQSALTKTISQLETDLDVKLFERGGGRRARPTAFGRIVYERGAAILSGAEEMQRYLAQVKQGYSQAIRIGFGVSVPGQRITRITELLRQKLPESSLRVRTGLRRQLMPRLRKKEFDFLIAMESRGDDAEDLTLDRLWEDRFCVFMSQETSARLDTNKDGSGVQWLASDRLAELDSSASEYLGEFLPAATVAAVDAYDRSIMPAMLKAGPFISAWPSETFADEVARGELAALEIPAVKGRHWRSRINMVSLKGGQRPRIVSTARQLVKRMTFD